jgi:hypothetical protein
VRYTQAVRRSLAILMVLLFGFPLISPLFALGGGPESSLPACCRRAGAHHCAGGMTFGQGEDTSPRIGKIPSCCESFPRAVSPSNHQDLTLDTAALSFAEVVSHPAIHRQTEARARVALDRSRRKRGPPATRLT